MSPFQCLRVQQGSEAMFVGEISGLPAPTVQWTWRGHPLEAGDGARAKTHYDEQTGRVCLVIPDLGPGDEGDYMCRADNPYGDSTCTITVCPNTFLGKPCIVLYHDYIGENILLISFYITDKPRDCWQ